MTEQTDETALSQTEILIPSLIDNASALGLEWSLRPATVQRVGTDTTYVSVICDGDEEAIRAIPLLGNVYVDARVMTMFVPPAGNYIIGFLTEHPVPKLYTSPESVSVTSSTTLVDTGLQFNAAPNSRYMVRARVSYFSTTAGDVRIAWNIPADAEMIRYILAPSPNSTSNADTTMIALRRSATTEQTAGGSGGTISNFATWWEDTLLITYGTGGLCRLRFAQATSNATATVVHNASTLEVQRYPNE